MSGPTIRADAHLPRQGAAEGGARPVVEVAVGILLQPDGRFLLTSRPPGKVYAGYWEFPGGKLEPGESVEQALARELHEELGLTIEPVGITRWREQLVDYPHALVRLHFCHAVAGRPADARGPAGGVGAPASRRAAGVGGNLAGAGVAARGALSLETAAKQRKSMPMRVS